MQLPRRRFILLTAFVWFKSDRNDCEIHGMSTQRR